MIEMCCPPLVVTCPANSPRAGEKITFSAATLSVIRATYKWHVSAGKIIAGQGTLRITVDTTGLGGHTIKATVEMQGGKNHETTFSSCEVLISDVQAMDTRFLPQRAEQNLAADGAIVFFSSKFVPSAWMLIARRS